jgi:hypothetical protein
MLASSTPRPTPVPPPGLAATQVPPARFLEAPTVLAHDGRPVITAPAPAGGRFAEVPTVMDPRVVTPAGTPRFADAKTVHAAPVLAPRPGQLVDNPETGTEMIDTGDMVEVTDPLMPRAQPPGPAAPVSAGFPAAAEPVRMPPPEQAYPHQPYYAHLASGGEPRRFPPWALGVMFVIVLALATGITVAIARAVS